jgi:signal transduction histidine kinase
MKILIVDDIETNRKLLRVNLECEGIETFEAADGIEALAALEREKADAIISDILMPHMDGYRLCREVRKNKGFGEVPFIFYTSTYTSPGDERLAMNCGADRYIKKPAPVAVILAAIRELSDPQRRRPTPTAQAEESLVMREYNETLVRKLEERNEKLERAREEIAMANEQLERRVKERTAELLLANQELEAFSHSIAHDLRSPLTAIDGFSYLLVDECRGKVSARAMDRLRFISEAASRMNELTNDLLRFARANRAEMSLEEMNLSALATAVLQDLQAMQPERSAECTVAPGIMAIGDFGLLRIVLENLLNNAWKYTGKTEMAQIEFGAGAQDGAPVFFVRDNRAGFDMAAAGKLFSAFCRLHSSTDFVGTGIGLSTVQRIITRHGGRIWADSSVGRGATFFFTLGASAPEDLP